MWIGEGEKKFMAWVLPAAALQSKCVPHKIKKVQGMHTCYHEDWFGQTEETRKQGSSFLYLPVKHLLIADLF